MNHLKGKIAFGLLCAVLGFILSVQFKTVEINTGGNLLPTQRAQQLSVELKNLRDEKLRLTRELSDLEDRLKEYEQSEVDESLIIKNLKKDLTKYQVLSGYKSIEGPGVIVTIDDPQQEYSEGEGDSFLMMNYDVILALINKLNAAGAEAISINDQRYVATTEIYYASNAVLINSVPTFPPYVIKAVGDPQTLEAALNIRYGIISEMKYDYNLHVTVEKEENIIIPKYNKAIKFKYARPIESSQ